jgi:hypothetical protein
MQQDKATFGIFQNQGELQYVLLERTRCFFI